MYIQIIGCHYFRLNFYMALTHIPKSSCSTHVWYQPPSFSVMIQSVSNFQVYEMLILTAVITVEIFSLSLLADCILATHPALT